jgi:YD repeat-containing protein
MAGYNTSYDYDVLDNLIKVMHGSQQRFFMYDSLKRLIRARNPEQGTHSSLDLTDPLTGNSSWSFGYSYDENSNLQIKTDARGFSSTYQYDALNRNTTVDYSNTPAYPDVARYYDNSINYGKGRYWYDYFYKDDGTIEHQAVDGYDALGRTWVRRTILPAI